MNYFFILLLLTLFWAEFAFGKRRHKQELRERASKEAREKMIKQTQLNYGGVKSKGIADGNTDNLPDDIEKKSRKQEPESNAPATPPSVTSANTEQFPKKDWCPPCNENKDALRHAIDSFWRNDLHQAYSCACNVLLARKNNGIAQVIVFETIASKYASFSHLTSTGNSKVPLPQTEASVSQWELLGPVPCGKLEIDGDPAISALREQYRQQNEQEYINRKLKSKVCSFDNYQSSSECALPREGLFRFEKTLSKKRRKSHQKMEENYRFQKSSSPSDVHIAKKLSKRAKWSSSSVWDTDLASSDLTELASVSASGDIAVSVLRMPQNLTVYSELIAQGVVTWRTVIAHY